MAKEITITASLQAKKAAFKFPLVGAEKYQVDMAGLGGGAPGLVVVGSTDQQVDLSDIDTPGWLWMRNIDANQTVVYGPNNGGSIVPFGRMKPGEPAVMRLDPGAGLRMQVLASSEQSESDSGENQAKVQLFVLED